MRPPPHQDDQDLQDDEDDAGEPCCVQHLPPPSARLCRPPQPCRGNQVRKGIFGTLPPLPFLGHCPCLIFAVSIGPRSQDRVGLAILINEVVHVPRTRWECKI